MPEKKKIKSDVAFGFSLKMCWLEFHFFGLLRGLPTPQATSLVVVPASETSMKPFVTIFCAKIHPETRNHEGDDRNEQVPWIVIWLEVKHATRLGELEKEKNLQIICKVRVKKRCLV